MATHRLPERLQAGRPAPGHVKSNVELGLALFLKIRPQSEK